MFQQYQIVYDEMLNSVDVPKIDKVAVRQEHNYYCIFACLATMIALNEDLSPYC